MMQSPHLIAWRQITRRVDLDFADGVDEINGDLLRPLLDGHERRVGHLFLLHLQPEEAPPGPRRFHLNPLPLSPQPLLLRPLPGPVIRWPVVRKRRDPGWVRHRRDRGPRVLHEPHLLPSEPPWRHRRRLLLRHPGRRRGLCAGVRARGILRGGLVGRGLRLRGVGDGLDGRRWGGVGAGVGGGEPEEREEAVGLRVAARVGEEEAEVSHGGGVAWRRPARPGV